MDKFDANTIEYADLLMLYRDEIVPYIYRYTLTDEHNIDLIFREQHFCKLMALDEFAPSQYKRREYLDNEGLQKIEEGTLTSKELKVRNNKKWKTYKNRIEYFGFIKTLLSNPEYIVFNSKNTSTKIKADIILLYRLSENELLHLFCKYIDKEKNTVIPVTYIVHKNDKYIKNQETKKIKTISKERK